MVMLAVYLLVSWLSETPRIDIDTEAKFTKTVADSNVGDFGGEVGMIGDVGVETIQKAKYAHLNKDKKVDREFGFEKLLHVAGDEWDIEKPFMNIFRRNFRCHITADKGKVQVEAGVDRPRPKDATLTGNVVIHILPESGSDIKESYVYLDDVVFISEESQFSTVGPVKFVSQHAQMNGTGMELVYNDELGHLEFLRIIHLETLRLKTSSEASLFSPPQTDAAGSAGTSSQVQTEPPLEPVAADVPQETEPSPTASTQVAEQAEGERYKCVFSKNVVIDCPQQLIFADELFINNITSGENDTASGKNSVASGEESARADTGGTDSVSTDSVKPNNVPVVSRSEPDESREEFVDIVVTCDNGIFVTPMDSSGALKNFAKLDPEATVAGGRGLENFGDTGGRPTFVAQRIDYDYGAPAHDIVAGGPSELTFYANDIMGAETTVPVKVTAQKMAKFMPASNQAVFEGDSRCTMIRIDSGIQQKYMLSAPKLTVNLSRDKSKQSSAFAAGIEHLTAAGGNVRLATVKRTGEKLLGGVELKCRRFDYDTARQLLLATGPGIIKVDNSNIAEPKKRPGRLSLRRQCYAIVQGFETLKYFLEANEVVADTPLHQIHIGYVPVIKGRYGQAVKATASHIEAFLYETADHRTELSALSATGGITYEEEAGKGKKGRAVQFVGSELFYDAKKSIITACGDEFQPCLLNGALVEGVEYNLKTGRAKSKIVGPGALQMR